MVNVPRQMSLRNSRSLAVAFVTFATFTDIIAYSVAVPVLPDLSAPARRLADVIGLLFASFGVTLLTVSMPMGAISDRIGRKPPIVGGLLALAAASVLFAYADSLPWLFAARLVQGAADAVTWVVGFALIADLYRPEERGRVMGLVMSGTSLAFMVGPTIGGWLYETGGIRLPFLFVAALALVGAAAFVWLDVPDKQSVRETVPVKTVMRVPAVAACFAAVDHLVGDRVDARAGAAAVPDGDARHRPGASRAICSASARSRRRCSTRSTAGW